MYDIVYIRTQYLTLLNTHMLPKNARCTADLKRQAYIYEATSLVHLLAT